MSRAKKRKVKMKKLVIAISAVLAAISLNAATVSWGSGTVTLASGATAAKNNVTGYVWESLSSTLYDQVKAGTLNVAAEFEKSGYGALGAYSATSNSKNNGSLTLTGVTDATTPNGVYAVVLFVDNTATGDAKYIANYAYSGDVGTTGVTVAELANYIGGKIGTETQGPAISGWSSASVPEPTSGLLFLLGVAGLALKRKRA